MIAARLCSTVPRFLYWIVYPDRSYFLADRRRRGERPTSRGKREVHLDFEDDQASLILVLYIDLTCAVADAQQAVPKLMALARDDISVYTCTANTASVCGICPTSAGASGSSGFASPSMLDWEMSDGF